MNEINKGNLRADWDSFRNEEGDASTMSLAEFKSYAKEMAYDLSDSQIEEAFQEADESAPDGFTAEQGSANGSLAKREFDVAVSKLNQQETGSGMPSQGADDAESMNIVVEAAAGAGGAAADAITAPASTPTPVPQPAPEVYKNPSINGTAMLTTGPFTEAQNTAGSVIVVQGNEFTSNGDNTFEGPDGRVVLSFDKVAKSITVISVGGSSTPPEAPVTEADGEATMTMADEDDTAAMTVTDEDGVTASEASEEIVEPVVSDNPSINGQALLTTGPFTSAQNTAGTVISAGGNEYTSNGDTTFEGPDGTVDLIFDKMQKTITAILKN